ncbi:MAG TPA: hypothetical protein VEA58_07210, partial [Anaerovoracaceae bacterium]|nr:hypothetical protein [Anaerovoracaceae bacterium]
MKLYFGAKAIEVRTVTDLFHQDYDAVCLSVIFSWDAPMAVYQAKIALSQGKKVLIGGGGTYKLSSWIYQETGIRPIFKPVDELEAVESDFKMVYFTRGCIENCSFCSVWIIEGQNVTLNRISRPAKVLMDNNLSEIPWEYKEFIVDRYKASGISSVDCNSGFEPKGMDEATI